MLDIFKFRRSRYCFIAQIICVINFSICVILPVHGASYSLQEISAKEYQWIEQYLHRINNSSSSKEWIHFLLKLKNFLDKKGYKSSSLLEMAHFYRSELESHGVNINEEDFDFLIHLICEKPSNFILSKNHHPKKRQQEAKVPAGLVIGFVKCLAGGLLCIIPHPTTLLIGGGLILSGIEDCLDEAKKQSEINERLNEQDSGNGNAWSYTF